MPWVILFHQIQWYWSNKQGLFGGLILLASLDYGPFYEWVKCKFLETGDEGLFVPHFISKVGILDGNFLKEVAYRRTIYDGSRRLWEIS